MSSQSISFRPAAVIRQIPWSLDRKAALGFLLVLVTFSLVGWLYLGQASVITSSTLQIEKLQQEIKLINQQNAELALEIAQLEASGRIKERALALGFGPTPPVNIRYLPVSDYAISDKPDRQVGLFPANDQPPTDPIWQLWLDNFVAWVVGKPSR